MRSITLKGVTVYDEHTTLNIEPNTITVISGPNGGGKSTWLEAASLCLYGKTLRGSSVWAGDDGYVRGMFVGGDCLVVERRRVKGKVTLTHAIDDLSPTYENTTKAQAALEVRLGMSFEVWRQCCVFSSGMASHFTLASDSERKRLLELVLGHDRFDAAHQKAHEVNRAIQANLASGTTAMLLAEREVQAHKQALAQFAAAQRPSLVSVAEAAQTITALKEEIAEGRVELDDANEKLGQARGRLHDSQEALRDILRGNVTSCPTCRRPFDDGKAEVEGSHHRGLHIEKLRGEVKEHASRGEAAKVEVERARGWVEKLTAAIDEASWQHSLAVSAEREKEHRAKMEAAVTVAEAGHAGAKQAHAIYEREALVSSETLRGLSPSGVRGQMLSDALAWIEATANRWLGELLPDRTITLRLTPTSERANGTVKDAIGMEVDGAGGGNGYKGASSGEQRRIDIAILLALSEVAASSHGATSQVGESTLWFDEVFDSLDADGVEAVVGVLERLARTRSVVVVTHNEELAERFDSLPKGTVRRVAVARGSLALAM